MKNDKNRNLKHWVTKLEAMHTILESENMEDSMKVKKKDEFDTELEIVRNAYEFLWLPRWAKSGRARAERPPGSLGRADLSWGLRTLLEAVLAGGSRAGLRWSPPPRESTEPVERVARYSRELVES